MINFTDNGTKRGIEFFTPWKWNVVYDDAPRIVQKHSITGNYRSSMYDMAYGGTYWVKGDWWSNDTV